ncbi:uncharacterized protein FIBRA_03332 [Fibroporia radiculosa]|uniref:Uncharacterized protein n=1 Tax=Fibroporia radiculosa TaxID=599839 RepID=J4G528_9APHY|nr:uncharacterized protein FIBRA_03332 [Fibroporia radiculosa]CCM01283.1 predicted protein [Fibroporia radiculosa]
MRSLSSWIPFRKAKKSSAAVDKQHLLALIREDSLLEFVVKLPTKIPSAPAPSHSPSRRRDIAEMLDDDNTSWVYPRQTR